MTDSAGEASAARPSSEDRLLARLRGVSQRVDPPPPAYVDFAKHALALTRLDVEIGRLQYDSYNAEHAGARGTTDHGYSATIAFSSLTLDIDIEAGRMTGRVTPTVAGDVHLQTDHGDRIIEIDPAGWFAFDATSTGPFRLVVKPATTGGARPLATEWLLA